MKQLVLYFMFFVASSLILIQCARIFPSPNGDSEIRIETKKPIGNKEKEKPAVANKLDKKNRKDNKNANVTYIAYWPYRMLQRINDARFFNGPRNVIVRYNFTHGYNLL